MNRYILVGREPVPCHDPDAWGSFMENLGARRVGWDEREVGGNTYVISTVFLGLDHQFGDEGPPLIFETMIFLKGNYRDLYCDRYSTYDQAEAGHAETVHRVELGLLP